MLEELDWDLLWCVVPVWFGMYGRVAMEGVVL